MSSFFTVPASVRKRKRSESNAASKGTKSKKLRESYKKAPEDEDISSESGSSDEGKNPGAPSDGEDEGEDEDYTGETAAEKRLRLAQQYLDNLHEEAGMFRMPGLGASIANQGEGLHRQRRL